MKLKPSQPPLETTVNASITTMESLDGHHNATHSVITSPLQSKYNDIVSPHLQRGFYSWRCPATCPVACAWGLGGLSFVNHYFTRVVVHAVPQSQLQACSSGGLERRQNLPCRCRARKRWLQRIARWTPCMWSAEYLICDQRALRSTETSS